MATNSSEGIHKEGQAVGVSLYLTECLDCLELDDDDNRVGYLQLKFRGKTKKEDNMVGDRYRQPNQDKEADERFYKQLGEVSHLLPLVLMEDFDLADFFWKYNTAKRIQSRRFLQCVEASFLTLVVKEPTREGAMLDLLFVNRKNLCDGWRLLQVQQE